MQTGTVKWFSDAKRLGFVTSARMTPIFRPLSDIEDSGFKSLAEDQKVWFETDARRKGLQAKNIQPV